MGTDPGYALRRYLMEAQTEIRTINEIGPASPPTDLVSRRTSHESPEWVPRSPQEANRERQIYKKWRENIILMDSDTKDDTLMRNFHGLQPLMVNYTPYELPASPTVGSRTFVGKGNVEPEGFPTFQPFRSSLRQFEQHDNLVELDNTPIDMTGRPLMGPFSAWHLPQKSAFGVSLEQLQERDGYVVPVLVQKCVCVLRRFALGMTHIYLDSFLEGDAGKTIRELLTRFDHGKNP